ncbi:hypothetical protein D9Q98_002984 [Chlorella vulgaris]|uniref:Plus3 domain-containing protein n=1 Tax=Chlorella vulgaris TaxID=3077 RepID=A0A9D4TUJ9_CHLVU|nr:hypothetical protein D9Q98_002984 [Chlorella vulgaris]
MSESSLDSELLAGAGAKSGGKKRKALSDSSEEEVSSEDVSLDDESELEEMRAASKKRAGGSASKQPARKRQARGRAASQSDDEADESSDEERLVIDEEELIEDEDDRKRLAAMTELQREYELANRADIRNQEALRRKLLAKKDVKAERAGAKAAKRVRSKSGREEREEAAKKSAMEELKAARERKARGVEERARKRDDSDAMEDEDGGEEEDGGEGGSRRRRSDDSSEEGALGSDDEMFDRERDLYGRRSREEGEDEEDEAPLEEVKKIQVRREKLEEWVNQPFFEDTLPGCMVRVMVGDVLGPDGMPVQSYRLCQVVAVETRAPGYYKDSGKAWPSPYAFGPSKEKTHKWLLVERGHSQRGMPLAQVSNTGFSQAEFESWQRALKEQGRPQVSRRTVKDTYARMVKANAYTYTAEDVSKLLQQKKDKGQAPHNIALEKARLGAQLAHAKEHGEDEMAAQLESQIAQLEGRLGAGKGTRQKHNMADLNKRNSDMNFKNALDNVSNKVGVAAGAQDANATQLDPFSRRATRPIVYWSTKRAQQAGSEAVVEDEPAPAAAAEVDPIDEGQQHQQQQQKRRHDLDAIVDLSKLDLSVLDRPARMPPMARKLLGPTWRPAPPPPGARIVSLEEYSRSKGLA